MQLSTLPGRVGAALLPPDAPGDAPALEDYVRAAHGGGGLHLGEHCPPGGWALTRDEGAPGFSLQLPFLPPLDCTIM